MSAANKMLTTGNDKMAIVTQLKGTSPAAEYVQKSNYKVSEGVSRCYNNYSNYQE
jgi:hypothetical protein